MYCCRFWASQDFTWLSAYRRIRMLPHKEGVNTFRDPKPRAGEPDPSVSSWAAAKLFLYNALVLSWPPKNPKLSGLRGLSLWLLELYTSYLCFATRQRCNTSMTPTFELQAQCSTVAEAPDLTIHDTRAEHQLPTSSCCVSLTL